MTNRPKQIGTATETAVARYAEAHGFPDAERIVLHGSLDEGDVQLVPGVIVEVKGGKAAETASDAQHAAWLAETEVERRNRRADVAFLVCKRSGKGAANAGQWWAWLPGWTYFYLAHRTCTVGPGTDNVDDFADHVSTPAVRVTYADALALLRAAGYGTPA